MSGLYIHSAAAFIGEANTDANLLKEELRLLSASHNLGPETFERVQSMRREIYDSEDYQEGIRSFYEKRPPQFRGK